MKPRSPPCADRGTRHAAGLTLVEILVTLAIVALLMTLAAPSFKPMLERWRVKQALGTLTDTLRVARSEAIKRGGNVVIQRNPGNDTSCALTSSPADWSCGWFMFFDANANGSYDETGTPGDERLQVFTLPDGIQVTHTPPSASIIINRWGAMDSLGASFKLVPVGAADDSPGIRNLCITSGGRIREAGLTC